MRFWGAVATALLFLWIGVLLAILGLIGWWAWEVAR